MHYQINVSAFRGENILFRGEKIFLMINCANLKFVEIGPVVLHGQNWIWQREKLTMIGDNRPIIEAHLSV